MLCLSGKSSKKSMEFKLLIIGTTLGLLTMTAYCENVISIGSNTVNVVFADATPTNSVMICQDLTNMFAFAHSLADVLPNSASPGIHRLRGKDPFMYPDSVKRGVSFVASATNQYLEISTELQNEYDAAFLFASSNSVSISQLQSFIISLNSLSHTNMVVEALVGMLENPPEIPAPVTAQFLTDMTSFCQMMEEYKYYQPSVLSIESKNGTVSAIVVMRNRISEAAFEVQEIKYVGGNWKLVFPR